MNEPVVMRAAARVPRDALFTRVDLIVTRRSTSGPARHCRHSANSPKSTIKLEKNLIIGLYFSLLFVPITVSLATRQLRALGGGFNHWPTAGEAGRVTGRVLDKHAATESVAGPARPLCQKDQKQTKISERECSGRNRIGCAAKLAPMLSLQTVALFRAHIHLLYL
jgi:hypothetical protein